MLKHLQITGSQLLLRCWLSILHVDPALADHWWFVHRAKIGTVDVGILMLGQHLCANLAVGPLLLPWINLIRTWINNRIFNMWDEVTDPFQTSTSALLTFGNGEVISSSHSYNRCNYLSMLGLKLISDSERRLWWQRWPCSTIGSTLIRYQYHTLLTHHAIV